jgi:hypothetical protein
MGPSFIKLGQALSTRADLLSDEVAARTLAKLQDHLPPFSGQQEARLTIERELGRPLDTMFACFDDVPAAAASIAQVHLPSPPMPGCRGSRCCGPASRRPSRATSISSTGWPNWSSAPSRASGG